MNPKNAGSPLDLKPEITITSFDEKSVSEYLARLEDITLVCDEHQPLIVNIDTFGGGIYGMSRIYEYLISLPNPIVTYTSSKAMSAGAILLSSAGSKGLRYASPNATIMIHEIQCGAYGDIKDVLSMTEAMKAENAKWMKILAKSMKGFKSADDIRQMLMKHKGRELYLSPKQAKKLGLIDKIGYIKMIPFQGYSVVAVNEEMLRARKGEMSKKKSTKKSTNEKIDEKAEEIVDELMEEVKKLTETKKKPKKK